MTSRPLEGLAGGPGLVGGPALTGGPALAGLTLAAGALAGLRGRGLWGGKAGRAAGDAEGLRGRTTLTGWVVLPPPPPPLGAAGGVGLSGSSSLLAVVGHGVPPTQAVVEGMACLQVPRHLTSRPSVLMVVSMDTALVPLGFLAALWHWILPHLASLEADNGNILPERVPGRVDVLKASVVSRPRTWRPRSSACEEGTARADAPVQYSGRSHAPAGPRHMVPACFSCGRHEEDDDGEDDICCCHDTLDGRQSWYPSPTHSPSTWEDQQPTEAHPVAAAMTQPPSSAVASTQQPEWSWLMPKLWPISWAMVAAAPMGSFCLHCRKDQRVVLGSPNKTQEEPVAAALPYPQFSKLHMPSRGAIPMVVPLKITPLVSLNIRVPLIGLEVWTERDQCLVKRESWGTTKYMELYIVADNTLVRTPPSPAVVA
ncbi:hypothetical protein CRUP_036584 [Coryphaenoides rupestris]|nr:hypothetical protein CRUP_036584 [Coryphaenoides rupestris]